MPFCRQFFFYIDELYNGIERVAISNRITALEKRKPGLPRKVQQGLDKKTPLI